MLSARHKLVQKMVHVEGRPDSATPEAIEAAYFELLDTDDWHDVQEELRRGEVETGLSCDSSRHYSSKAVVAQMLDGSWVGWTYWFGGGKHGEPGSMPWMETAYSVIMREETRVVKVFYREVE